MTRPRRILLCVVATHLDGLTSADTVLRAWWRGTTLTRVVLRHAGPRHVVAVTRVAAGDFRGLRVLHLGAAFALPR